MIETPAVIMKADTLINRKKSPAHGLNVGTSRRQLSNQPKLKPAAREKTVKVGRQIKEFTTEKERRLMSAGKQQQLQAVSHLPAQKAKD